MFNMYSRHENWNGLLKPYQYYRVFLFIWFVIATGIAFGQKYIIKFATLAPEGSTWMNVMHQFDNELNELTQGEVKIRIYSGGVLGDEMDVLRKIRIGQLHAAGFTGFGLGEISSRVRILDTPMLFHDYEEVDYIYEKFGDAFSNHFVENGFELLGWAEVGFVYIFTKEFVRTPDELQKIKMWVWQGDRVAETTFKAFGTNIIPLSIVDVMTALQTNMVNGVYTSPLAIVALQWFTKVNYMIEIPLADATGAVLISTKMFNRLPEAYQKLLKSLGQKYMCQLTRLSREENDKAIETLKEQGIEIVQINRSDLLEQYYAIGDKARLELVGKYFNQELLDQIKSSLNQFRHERNNQKK